jgi:hypothetical protein
MLQMGFEPTIQMFKMANIYDNILKWYKVKVKYEDIPVTDREGP